MIHLQEKIIMKFITRHHIYSKYRMTSVWSMILQRGRTIKVSIELPVTTRHPRDMTERLLKATLYLNHTHSY